jgi:hypothetical protein
MATLQEIDRLAERFAGIRGKLTEEVAALNDEIEAARKRHLQAVKRLVERAAEAHGELLVAIGDSRGLFVKPKSLTLHGVRVGYRKGSGTIEFEDADQVVELIEKKLADKVEILIVTKKKPNKKALAQLDVADLKKIGCTVEGTDDVAFIEDAASDVDKLVRALLKEATEEVEA